MFKYFLYMQFDNLKRVYKTVTSDFRTPAVEVIQRNFGISRDLSRLLSLQYY